ncbi:Mandelate racemase [Olavius algarvensis associated proteobacterium Delta 3]|nr:Mandelate racemase [Olavius algarvensis associated proteobacterium Delta 3]CAB5159473.1 Mandelate racemase [Olavius algarvensis associated proteobacterium Delta 3]
MPLISRIELYHVAIPLPARFYPSWIPGFPQTKNRFTLIRVLTESGLEGFSAGPAMGRERAGLGDLIGPYLVGEDATDIDLIQQRVREMSYLGWRNAWIEPAFWDIQGKMAGKPVYELLGGEPCTVRLYASTGEVKLPEERVEEAEARFEEGFRTIKLRVHDFDEMIDIHQVREVSKAIGHRMRIGVDANQGWRVTIVKNAPLWDLERAKRFSDRCADFGVDWLEEPLPMDAYEDLSKLTAYSRVPIAGGELHTAGFPELKMMIERRCYRIFQPDAVFTGGIAQTFQIIRLCRRQGLTYTPHTWTNGIGFAINLQLMAASGYATEMAVEYPYNPPGWTVEARDGLLESPFDHDQGMLQVPKLPGLGFTIDRNALKRFGRRFFVMDRKRLIWHAIRTRGLRTAREINRAKRESRMRQSSPTAKKFVG